MICWRIKAISCSSGIRLEVDLSGIRLKVDNARCRGVRAGLGAGAELAAGVAGAGVDVDADVEAGLEAVAGVPALAAGNKAVNLKAR